MELQAIDSYQVKLNGTFNTIDAKTLTMLYQPLMGTSSLALYQTLAAEVEENRLWTAESRSHMQLLSMLHVGLEELFEARLKLEGLGLLKVFMKDADDTREYVYEILPPLSPAQFFGDGLLNIYLFSQVGEKQFKRLRTFFSDKPLPANDYKEVTRSFQDVFETFKGTAIPPDVNHVASEVFQKSEPTVIQLDKKTFDFEAFYQMLSPQLITREQITPAVEQALVKMHTIYGASAEELVTYLYRALEPSGDIDLEYLRKIVRNGYHIETGKLPALSMKQSAPQEKIPEQSEPASDEEALQIYLENITPFQLLVDIADGARPAETDLKIVEEVMEQQQLPTPVMNVLIEYVLLRLDGKIARNYMMTIAAHWKRKKVQTAKDAMELAWAEHEKYKRLQEETKDKPTNYSRRGNGKKEVLPEWFDKETAEPTDSKMTNKEKQTLEEQVREIKEKLKKR